MMDHSQNQEKEEQEETRTTKPRVAALIAAGGRGERFGRAGGKQYFPLAGKPIIVHCLEVFQKSPLVDTIVIATEKKYLKLCRRLAKKHRISKVAAVVSSGAERYQSVKNALLACPGNTGYVLVHDGSRPLISLKLVARVVEAAKKTGAAVPGLPVVDTIKMVSPEGEVANTPNRDFLRCVQTPQGFECKLLRQAYKLRDVIDPTDDSSLVEEMRSRVAVVAGERENIKITYPDDIKVAECYLRCRKAAKKAKPGRRIRKPAGRKR